MSAVLHPELFATIPVVGDRIADNFETLANKAQQIPQINEGLSVVVRTLNEEVQLEQLLRDIDSQDFYNDVEVVVVDNESHDRTTQVARSFGATVVTLARDDFTYPRTMNLGVDAASHDLVWMTVGHALPSTSQLLHGGALHFTDEAVGGAFSATSLPNANASISEKAFGVATTLSGLSKSRNIKKAGIGTMAAVSAMIRKGVWEELGRFDERYETGGEDTAMGRRMLEAGYQLRLDPVLAVHHSHGLSPIAFVEQARGWMNTVHGPVKLDRQKLAIKRPHLSFE